MCFTQIKYELVVKQLFQNNVDQRLVHAKAPQIASGWGPPLQTRRFFQHLLDVFVSSDGKVSKHSFEKVKGRISGSHSHFFCGGEAVHNIWCLILKSFSWPRVLHFLEQSLQQQGSWSVRRLFSFSKTCPLLSTSEQHASLRSRTARCQVQTTGSWMIFCHEWYFDWHAIWRILTYYYKSYFTIIITPSRDPSTLRTTDLGYLGCGHRCCDFNWALLTSYHRSYK